MEQKKILWIIVSVTVFLCVIFVAGLLWFYPSKDVQTASVGTDSKTDKANVDFDPVEWVRNSKDYPGLDTSSGSKDTENEGFTIVYGETDGQTTVGAVNDSEKNSGTDAPAVTSAPPVRTEYKKPAAVTTKAVETPKVAASPEKVKVREYWIQAGSFKSRSGAENAKKILAKEGLTSRITIKTIDSTDYYRVRIGPYTRKEEAAKFLDWVKKVDTFDKSYISMVISER